MNRLSDYKRHIVFIINSSDCSNLFVHVRGVSGMCVCVPFVLGERDEQDEQDEQDDGKRNKTS